MVWLCWRDHLRNQALGQWFAPFWSPAIFRCKC
ncbi:Uncharacterised protein [Vibrio cholerae]|nr:Uncharacterised protein [Vibrio cholerae]